MTTTWTICSVLSGWRFGASPPFVIARNAMNHSVKIIGQANRLRVFAAVKAHMEATGECPLATDIAEKVGLSPAAVLLHMKGLRGATGLPVPITNGRKRWGDRQRDEPKDETHAALAAHRRYGDRDHGPVPLTELFE